MKKNLVLLVLICALTGTGFSQAGGNIDVTIEITNVAVKGGKVYLAIFADADQFKKEEPLLAFDLGDSASVLQQTVSLAPGEYVLSAIQDANGNGTLDFNLFGIPKELVAISNYNGKGFPSRSFDKQKVMINGSTGKVSIGLYKF